MLVLATACNNDSYHDHYACPQFIPLLTPDVVYPVPGDTAVPTAPGEFVVADGPTGNITLQVVPSPGASAPPPLPLGGLTDPPSPLPSPIRPPFDPHAVLRGIAHPQLAPRTHYLLMFQGSEALPATNGCSARVAISGATDFMTGP